MSECQTYANIVIAKPMKKIAFILTVIVFLIIINGLIHSIFDLMSKQDLLTSSQKLLEAEKLKNTKLKSELVKVESKDFIDEQAHNKLFMVKDGEQQVLISQKLIQSGNQKKAVPELPNWQKWINLFF